MKALRQLCLAAVWIAAAATAASAQPAPNVPYGSNHCTTINGFGGVSWSSSDPGGMFGGALGWELYRWFGVEGSAAWLDRPEGEQGFKGSLDAHFKLPWSEKAEPFLKTGFGLYHASFDSPAHVTPQFYHQRMQMDDTSIGMHQTFTDPAVVVGGGVNLFLSPRVSLRPDYEAIIAIRDGESLVTSAFTLHLAYHFADHPITPWRLTR